MELIAATPLTPILLRVRPQMVSSGPTPPDAKSRLPEMMASFIGAPHERHPFGLEVEAEPLAVLLQELVLLHDGERQVGDAQLLGDAHGLRVRGAAERGQCGRRQHGRKAG